MNATPTVLGLLVAALVASSSLAAPPRPQPRRGAADDVRRPAADPDLDARRLAPEPSPASSARDRLARDAPWEVTVRRRDGCQAERLTRLRDRLLALENASDLMSLEVWGDAHAYAPYDQVMFYFRAPRAMYVTLYWIGPEGQVTVPVENLRVPGNRDAAVDTGGFIVPPFGREQWVALGTLEPIPLGCFSEDGLIAGVDARLKVPHGVGRWEVWSKDVAEKDPR